MKINYWLIALLVLLSPSQLGIHFWPEWSLVDGIKIDFLSPTLYFTDLLFLGTLIISGFRFRKSKFIKLLGAIFLGLFFVSGKGQISSAYWSLRYLQVPALAWIIYVNGKKLNFPVIVKKWLALPLLFTLVLEIWQFLIKKSTGWWWIFGERSFSLATPNIAAIDLWGQKFLRPYATFSHPNALAGWLLLAGFILWGNRKKRLLALSGILLTFSRNAVLAFVVGALSFSFFANQKFFQSIISFPGSSFGERTILNQSALKAFVGHPVFGVGPGQLLPALPGYFPPGYWKIQPPHNVFILVLAETGIFGFAVLLTGIFKIYSAVKKNPLLFPGLIAIFSSSLLDHYWLTSQQNRIILGIYLGLCLISGFGGNHQTPVPALALGIRSNIGPGRKLHMNDSSLGRS